MTSKQYYLAVSEAQNYTDVDAYVSDMALSSSLWGVSGDDDTIPPDRIDDLRAIWEAVNRSFRDILTLAGMSQASFCRRFVISRITVGAWYNETRRCTIYDRLMFQQLLGLLDVEIVDV